MKNMTLKNIALAAKGQYYGSTALENSEVDGICIDSREVKSNFLFVAVKGEKVDGHSFINKAYQSGAICCLSEELLEDNTEPYIVVESTLQAIKDIAEFYRESLSIKVIGVSGSVGKTSTKEFVSSVLEQKYNVLKTSGNFNNEIGLPLTIFKLKEEHEIAVLEMGISDFGEMHRLSKIAKPDVCVLTNIGYCHLENLINREGVLKAKSEMFDYSSPTGIVVLNGDDDLLQTIAEVNHKKPLFFGLNEHNDVMGENLVDLGLKGQQCTINDNESKFTVTIPIPGKHMVYNALAATTIAKLFKLTNEQIRKGIESITSVSGRVNIIETEKITVIDDCYNANPVSMKASLDVLASATNRRVCILGDMFELGDHEKQYHYEIGEYVANSNIDVLICIGSLAKHIFEGASHITSDTEKYYYASKEECLQNLNNIIKSNDAILVKASHGMKFDQIVKTLIDNSSL